MSYPNYNQYGNGHNYGGYGGHPQPGPHGAYPPGAFPQQMQRQQQQHQQQQQPVYYQQMQAPQVQSNYPMAALSPQMSPQQFNGYQHPPQQYHHQTPSWHQDPYMQAPVMMPSAPPPQQQQQQQQARQYPHQQPSQRSHQQPAAMRQPQSQAQGAVQSATQNQVPPAMEEHKVLLSLAEEYVTAAYKLGPKAAITPTSTEIDQYYKLIALALGCLESVLSRWKLYPRVEATVRLRYAILLFQETENYHQAEAVLTKGISLCDRNKLYDLKYGMIHLLCRIFFQSSHRTGLKHVDNTIPDIETQQRVPWLYAFRFLRVALSLQADNPEYSAALHHLRAIVTTAESRSDSAMIVTASSIEAMVHLYHAHPESVEQAQRAIANARGWSYHTSQVSHLMPLLESIDVACSIQQCQVEQAANKVKGLQAVMDKYGHEVQKDDGSLTIVIENGFGGHLTTSTGGVFRRNEQGQDVLVLSWLKRRDLYILGYYLSGVAAHLKNATDVKAEKYIKEGLSTVSKNLSQPESEPSSLTSASSRALKHTTLAWYMRLHLTFCQTFRNDWQSAQKSLKFLQKGITFFPEDDADDLRQFTLYLQGVVHQGFGKFDAALASYRSPELAMPTSPPRGVSNPKLDLQLLAALNTLSIISPAQHPEHHLVSGLVSQLEPYCLSHPNKSLVSAFHFVRASSSSQQESVVKLKENLQFALNGARSVYNTQLMCIAMSLMTASLFNNIAGDQAEKSGATSKSLAHRWGNKMWIAVADGLLANTLEMRGKLQEAHQVRIEADACMNALPEPLKKECSEF